MYSLKHCEFKRAREDYAAALQQFNVYRRQHYTQTLKNWGEEGQMIETFRIVKTQELINILVERLRVTIDRMNAVCVDLESAAALIDVDKVSVSFTCSRFYLALSSYIALSIYFMDQRTYLLLHYFHKLHIK